jgi:hypothetical protein
MLLLRLAIVLAVLLFLIALISQVLIPIYRGTPLFPQLRSPKESKEP